MLALIKRGALGATALLAFSAPSLAHVTLEVREAAINSTYKAVARVPHGCEGAATLKVRVQVPDGFVNVKPMPKAGWTLETVKGKYEKAYGDHGRPLTEGVKEIVWTGKLLDEHYDEFVFRGMLTKGFLPVRCSTFPSCRNARAARRSAGSRSRPPARARTITSSPRRA